MPFIFLLLFALILLQTHWPEPPSWLTAEGCAILVGTIVLTSWLSAGLIAEAVAWQMTRHPEHRSNLLRRYSRWRRNHFILLLTAYLIALYYLGWGHVLQAFMDKWTPWWFRSKDNLPGFHLGLLIPLFAGLLLSWERFFQVEKTAYTLVHDADCYMSRWAYLLLHVRRHFIFVMLAIMVTFLLQMVPVFVGGGDEQEPLLMGLSLGIMVAFLLALPIFLRLFWGLKPLPPGPLRDRLIDTARRLGFRYSNVLVWDTRNLVANAMVTGFVPWIRYIVLTDRLINDLDPDEIEAVFGHEIGHIKHHHLPFYLAFILTSFILLGALWGWAGNLFTIDQIVACLEHFSIGDREEIEETLPVISKFVKLALVAAYTLVLFSFISRRCERQADLFGAKTVSTDAFISALEKVADINGIGRTRFSWLHPSIAQRVDFLREMRGHPARALRFHISVLAMQLALFGILGWLLLNFDLLDIWKMLAEF
jgi:STE24 endopeptidase